MSDPVARVLSEAVDAGLCPGVAASVVTRDGRRRRWCEGRLMFEPGAFVVDESTVWDLASLTKLLCTTVLAAAAVDDGLLTLEERPWPGWPGVSIAHVLRHDGGLRAHAPFFDEASRRGVAGLRAGRDLVVQAVLDTPPIDVPGARTIYSDLGFIALGALLEDRFGTPLDVAFARYAVGGLRFVRLADVGYHPAVPRVAPTERCPWRRRLVHGQVHDENAWAMGGVAGHAGLFGSLLDVEEAALGLLRAITEDTTLARFARHPTAHVGGRALGFDRPSPGGSTGDALSSATVGHLGFTGTSVWIDPALAGGTAFVLLANTVHSGRDDVVVRNRALRRAFHVAAADVVAGGV